MKEAPTAISAEMRRDVVERARERCEYCFKPQIAFFSHEVDHIIARKHHGETILENLAFACFECNRYKGSDIASLDPQTNKLTPLFNPRTQQWPEHFQLENGSITPLTPEGRVTVFLLRLNDEQRIMDRFALGVGVD